jgi:hypothetical protein
MFNQITNLYIMPEIRKRRDEGKLSNEFRVKQCLIKLPRNREPIVLFNDEVSWRVKVVVSEAVQAGDTPYLHQLTDFDSVVLPEESGERVAFIFLKHRVGDKYDIIFDATPNQELALEERQAEEKQVQDLFITLITQNLTDYAAEVFSCNETQSMLYKNGLWLIPRLMPYPLSEVVRLIETSPKEAIATIQKYCYEKDLLEKMLEDWQSVDIFKSRQTILEDCCFAHKNGKHSLSIHTLMPQLEGIITDWIFTQLPDKEVPWKQESKTKKFKDILINKDPFSLSYPIVVESAISFIVDGPVLSTFKKWFDTVDNVFPNRNVVQHGRYEESLYTEINSLRLFLLLDTIFYLIKDKDGEFLDGSKYILVSEPAG